MTQKLHNLSGRRIEYVPGHTTTEVRIRWEGQGIIWTSQVHDNENAAGLELFDFLCEGVKTGILKLAYLD